MPGQTFPQPRLTNQPWVAHSISPYHLIPGGSVLDLAAAWPNPVDHPELRGVPANRKVCPSGTLIARIGSTDIATPSPAFVPYDDATHGTDANAEIYLVPFDNLDIDRNNSIELLLPSKMTVIYWNWMPNWVGRPAEEQAKIRQLYHCIRGGDITEGVDIGATTL